MTTETRAAPMSPTPELHLLTTPTVKESSSKPSEFETSTPSTPPPPPPPPQLRSSSFTASIPFKWELEPGKPLPCTALITRLPSEKQLLQLPPRLQLVEPNTTKLPSPSTVLDGPYQAGSEGCSGKTTVGEMVLGDHRRAKSQKRRGLFGSWGGSENKDIVGGSFVLPSEFGAADEDGAARGKRSTVRRNSSFSNLSSEIRPRFWVSVYEGLKQVVTWRSKKLKKRGLRV